MNWYDACADASERTYSGRSHSTPSPIGIICMSPYSTCEPLWSSNVISAAIFESLLDRRGRADGTVDVLGGHHVRGQLPVGGRDRCWRS